VRLDGLRPAGPVDPIRCVTPIKARDESISDTTEMESFLDTGVQRAREVSERTIAVVYERLGFP
jgi:tryptophanyl-tRNA synthetase